MLKTQGARRDHPGGGPVPRASLGRLNAEQPETLFAARFHKLAAAAQRAGPGHRFRFKGKLWSFDASLIERALSLFPWAHVANRKAAVKRHIGLDHGGYLPGFAAVAAPPASDAEFVRRQILPPGSSAVFDKGCVSFARLAELTQRGAFFVTGMKEHNRVRVRATHPVRPGSGVAADETVQIQGQAARGAAAAAARDLPRCRDRATPRLSHQPLSARRAHHRRSWQGALADRAVVHVAQAEPQSTRLVGAPTNAVLTQIWIALWVYLLLAYLKFAHQLKSSMQPWLRLLHLDLFPRRDLPALRRADSVDPPPKWQQNQLVLV